MCTTHGGFNTIKGGYNMVKHWNMCAIQGGFNMV